MNGYTSSPAYSTLSPIHNGPSAAAATGTLIPLGATFPAVSAVYTQDYCCTQVYHDSAMAQTGKFGSLPAFPSRALLRSEP